jgi:hypothetical protein
MGIDAAGVANYKPDKVMAAFIGTARKVSRMRTQHRGGQAVSNDFTDEERKEMS